MIELHYIFLFNYTTSQNDLVEDFDYFILKGVKNDKRKIVGFRVNRTTSQVGA